MSLFTVTIIGVLSVFATRASAQSVCAGTCVAGGADFLGDACFVDGDCCPMDDNGDPLPCGGDCVGEDDGGDTVAHIQERGALCCGVSLGLAGFSTPTDDGGWAGYDVDYCRAVAAAILGEDGDVEFVPLNAGDRFPALADGIIDVLIRNTTWTFFRDVGLPFNFAPTTFYDGQGFMVRADSGIENLEDLAGATVCVIASTTTELNLIDLAKTVSLDILSFADSPGAEAAYDDGTCDAITTDASGLVGVRTHLSDPSAHVVLAELISREPLGPVVRQGDERFFDAVKWVVFALFLAEQKGITQENARQQFGQNKDAEVRRLLGREGALGELLGLNRRAFLYAILTVGNSGEIYNRNLGPDTPTAIPRGLNALFSAGGLWYPMPFR